MKHTSKKGINLTFETIVIAVVVLIVMVIVIMFFTNSFGPLAQIIKGTGDCQARDSTCYPENAKPTGRFCYQGSCPGKDWCCPNE
ncbi:hypothetical protein HY640_04585 [Candidatus Woesearchaeota archaeon]|nr:hypothetical protein [Candidatus Woesearchaeota archaeon]